MSAFHLTLVLSTLLPIHLFSPSFRPSFFTSFTFHHCFLSVRWYHCALSIASHPRWWLPVVLLMNLRLLGKLKTAPLNLPFGTHAFFFLFFSRIPADSVFAFRTRNTFHIMSSGIFYIYLSTSNRYLGCSTSDHNLPFKKKDTKVSAVSKTNPPPTSHPVITVTDANSSTPGGVKVNPT